MHRLGPTNPGLGVVSLTSYRMVTRKLVRTYVCMIMVGFGAVVLGVAEIVAAGNSSTGHGFRHVYVGWALPAGFVVMLIGIFLIRFRVVVGNDRLTTYKVKRVQRAPKQEIAAIELRTKPWGTFTGPVPVRVPYVKLRDRSGFWLEPLAGTAATSAPSPKQLAVLNEIRATLGVDGKTTPPATDS